MRIDKIEICNFRQYGNATFDFTAKYAESDLHIILGENSMGKSNALNAITWCLYGEEMHLQDKSKALDPINSPYVHAQRLKGNNKGEISVVITVTIDDYSKLVIERVANYSIMPDIVKNIGYKLIVSEMKNNEWRTIENEEEAEIIIHRYFPNEINGYIFFDGEQLEKYFQKEQYLKNIAAVNGFTQSDIIDKVIAGFERAQKDLEPQISNSGDKELEEKSRLVNEKQDAVTQLKDSIDAMEVQRDKCQDEISKLDRIIGGKEILKVKTQRLAELEAKSNDLVKKRESLLHEMMTFARESYTYLALYPAIKIYSTYINQKSSENKLPPVVDKDLLRRILTGGKCIICDSELDESHIAYVDSLLSRLEMTSETSARLNTDKGVLSTYLVKIKKYKSEKEKYLRLLSDIDGEIKSCDSESSQIEQYLKTEPNTDDIVQAVSSRETYKKQLSMLEQKIGSENLKLEQAKEQLAKCESEKAKLLEKNKTLKGLLAQLQYCKKAIIMLSDIRRDILEQFRQRLEAETFEIFKSLAWSKEKYSKLQIDKNYEVDIFNQYGERSTGSCSAGETALLALSYTIALQKESKHDSLLFIDTPLGRIDEANRRNFSEVLMKLAKDRQIILTFTNTEYDVNVKPIIAGNHSSFNKLYQTEDAITMIKND